MADETETQTQDSPKDDAGKTSPVAVSGGEDWKAKFEASQRELNKVKRSGLSDLERAKAEADDARKEAEGIRTSARAERLEGKLVRAAAKAGASNPDRVARMLASDGVTLDDNDQLVGVDKALKDLRGELPALFTPAPGPRGGGGGTSRESTTSQGTGRMNDLIRQQLNGGR